MSIDFEIALERAGERIQAHYTPDFWRWLNLGRINADGEATVLVLLASFEPEEAPPGEHANLSRLLVGHMEALGWPTPEQAAPAFAALMCDDVAPC